MKRGSALIVAMFLMVAIGGVAFGVGRLFFLESQLSNVYENSTIAYYIAESGLEEGLLRYRYDKNLEYPVNVSSNPNNVYVNNLSMGTVNSGSGNSDIGLDKISVSSNPSDMVFTTNLTYRALYFGTDINNSNYIDKFDLKDEINPGKYDSVYTIPKDEVYKIDITDIVKNSYGTDGASDFNIYLKFKNLSSAEGCSLRDTLIETKIVGKTNLGLSELKTALITPLYKTTHSNIADDIELVGPVDTSQSELEGLAENIYELDNFIAQLKLKTSFHTFDSSGDKFELYLNPRYCAVTVGIQPAYPIGSTPKPQISAPWNTVKSTAYFGGIARTLQAKIDRQAGTIYDLYDYVIYDVN